MCYFEFQWRDETQVEVVLSPILTQVAKIVSTGHDKVKHDSSKENRSPGLAIGSPDGQGQEQD